MKTLQILVEDVVNNASTVAFDKLRDCFAFKVDLEGKPVTDIENQDEIVFLLNSHARKGNGLCQALLGIFYLFGMAGLKPDMAKALDYAKRSAGIGDSFGMGEALLTYFYLNGHGVKQDIQQALHWNRLAEQKNNSYALNNMGSMIENGLGGLKINLAEAFNYYRRSAELGNSFGMYNLARCYENGIGVSQNYSAAFSWYERSSKMGNVVAQNNLGRMYELGFSVEPNLDEAIKYYVLGARLGLNIANINIERLRKLGYSEQIDKIKTSLNL